MNKLTGMKYSISKVFRVHQAFVVLVVVLAILLAAFVRVNTLSNTPLNQTYLDQESAKIKSVNFNDEAIAKIKALSDSNVATPGTDLQNNRKNPFNE